MDLAIDIFVGWGWIERRNSGCETENPGTANWISPAAVENGGALGHALMGRIRGRRGAEIATSSRPRDTLPEAQKCPRSAIRWEGARDRGTSRAPPEGPLKRGSRGWFSKPDPELRLTSRFGHNDFLNCTKSPIFQTLSTHQVRSYDPQAKSAPNRDVPELAPSLGVRSSRAFSRRGAEAKSPYLLTSEHESPCFSGVSCELRSAL